MTKKNVSDNKYMLFKNQKIQTITSKLKSVGNISTNNMQSYIRIILN
jgi:hypothetical protein